MRVIGYVRCSTNEQADSRAGINAQRASIAAEAARRGWDVVDVIEDAGYSAKDLKRPGVQAALDALSRGEAGALVVAKLDRMSRSMVDFAGLMATAQRSSWGVVALDVNVDTTTAAGEMVANVMATFAQFERRLIGQRTKEALAAKRAAGVRLGAPPTVSAAVEHRVAELRAAGVTYAGVAERLADEGLRPPRGGAWRPSTLHRVAARAARAVD
jgi:DNA invertase Pin-like site-specific DNA recombinase